MIKQRVFYGSMMILVIAGIVVFDGMLSNRALHAAAADDQPSGQASSLVCALLMTLLVVILVVLATYELGRLCVSGGYRPSAHWAALVSAGLAFLPWLDMQRAEGTLNASVSSVQVHMPLSLWWIAGGLLGACLAALLRRTTERALSNMALTVFMILYLGLLGSFAVRIRCMDAGARGAALVVYFILTVKSGDIGAYFTGMAIGKHKLVPWLSPGKTIEGAIGAAVFAALVAAGGVLLWPHVQALGRPPFSIPQALVFGSVMAIVGHLGDLTESAFKRDVGIKDSGRIVPAFGGLLDILDSPLFAAPIAWWLLIIQAR